MGWVMIPLRDTIPSSSFPFVNIVIIILNILIFFYEVSLGNQIHLFINKYGLIPAYLIFSSDITTFERIYPFFTSMFLHGGWFHLIGNMLFLYVFGDNVEDRMGHFRYLLFYLLSGIAAAFTQVLTNIYSTVPMVGASGAISGVLGAYMLFFPTSRILTLVPIFFFIQLVEIPAVVFLFIWFIIQFFSGIASLAVAQNTGGIAFWAHIGGFVAGLALARFFQKRRYYYRTRWFR
jgi:membrane associated rhomboid family serine protease